MAEEKNEGAEVVDQEVATKRKVMSLSERIKVIDFLRSQVEPIVGDSNAEVVSKISEATKVEMNWQQMPTVANVASTAIHHGLTLEIRICMRSLRRITAICAR